MSQTFKEVEYTCTNPKCNHKQTVRYFADDKVLPFTCCVHCRAGFGVELAEMAMNRRGMFPTSTQTVHG